MDREESNMFNIDNEFSSPGEAFRMAAELIRFEGDKERKRAMREEQWDRNNPDIRNHDYFAARLEMLARDFDTWAHLTESEVDLPNEHRPPLTDKNVA